MSFISAQSRKCTWRHRIWPRSRGEQSGPKPALEKIMSQAQIEAKVEEYLRNSDLLTEYWHRPITREQLQAEMERMARNTKQPEVLRELFQALEAISLLLPRARGRPGYGTSGRRVIRRRQRPALCVATNPSCRQQIYYHDARHRYLRSSRRSIGAPITPGRRLVPLNAPAARFRHTAVWTGSEMIVWGGTLTARTV